jgi:hypothetical protein
MCIETTIVPSCRGTNCYHVVTKVDNDNMQTTVHAVVTRCYKFVVLNLLTTCYVQTILDLLEQLGVSLLPYSVNAR